MEMPIDPSVYAQAAADSARRQAESNGDRLAKIETVSIDGKTIKTTDVVVKLVEWVGILAGELDKTKAELAEVKAHLGIEK